MDNIIKFKNNSYERIIPTNIDEAMQELDRRIMITGQMNLGKVNARIIVKELLQDYTQGLQSRSNLIIL